MKYIAYYKKDPIVIPGKVADGLILSRIEIGLFISPTPKEDEDFIKIDNLDCVVFPNEDDNLKALFLKVITKERLNKNNEKIH